MIQPYDARQQYFYERRYALDIIPYKQTTGVTYGNETPKSPNLRVQFEIERSFASAADKGKIVVYNMTATNRNAVVRGTYVRLRAGYRGNTGLIFSGYVRKVQSEQQGPDTTLTMECGDAEPVVAYGYVSRSYDGPVSLAQVLQDIAKDLQLRIGGQVVDVAPGVIRGIPNDTFPPGLVLEGSVKQILDLYLHSQLIDWTIQNDQLIILPKYAPLYLGAIVLSKETGMTGVPGFNEKYATFQSLLNPNLVPGAYVQVRSANKRVSGFYKARSCKIQGDTHDAPWTISVEAEALKEPLPFVPTAQGGDFTKAVV